MRIIFALLGYEKIRKDIVLNKLRLSALSWCSITEINWMIISGVTKFLSKIRVFNTKIFVSHNSDYKTQIKHYKTFLYDNGRLFSLIII